MFSFCTMSCVVFVYFFASNKFPNLLFRPIKYKLVRFLLDELGIALQMHKDLKKNHKKRSVKNNKNKNLQFKKN